MATTSWYRKRGRPSKTYIDQLIDDTNLKIIEDMKTMMEDKEGWKNHVVNYRASSTCKGKNIKRGTNNGYKLYDIVIRGRE